MQTKDDMIPLQQETQLPPRAAGGSTDTVDAGKGSYVRDSVPTTKPQEVFHESTI